MLGVTKCATLTSFLTPREMRGMLSSEVGLGADGVGDAASTGCAWVGQEVEVEEGLLPAKGRVIHWRMAIDERCASSLDILIKK